MMTFTTEFGVIHVFRLILRRITLKNESNPQRPQQLRCWEKMKTLMFSLTSKHRARGLLVRHCWCYSCSSVEKMEDSLQPLTAEAIATQGCQLLQSSVSHDPSEVILICWFAAKEMSIFFNNIVCFPLSFSILDDFFPVALRHYYAAYFLVPLSCH